MPLIASIDQLDVTRHRTRASGTNRDYTAASTRFDGTADPVRVEFLYDAQTSGGLLVSVPADRADELVSRLRSAGTPAAAVVGEVLPRAGEAIRVVP